MNKINPVKCIEFDYINFLIASSRVFSFTAASKCRFIDSTSPAHDSFTRPLARQSPNTGILWEEVKNRVTPEIGLLVIDDTVLDKPYSKHMDLVYMQWSGKHHQIVNGINLGTVVWNKNDTNKCSANHRHGKNNGASHKMIYRGVILTVIGLFLIAAALRSIIICFLSTIMILLLLE